MNLEQLDKELIWHPFTQEKNSPLAFPIIKGEGAYLFDDKGNKYLDLISSWWVNLHGHGHPKIAEAIYKQALELEHVIFAGFTHKPAVELCRNLQKVLHPTLKRFFFSDNGSTAVEVALKMASQFWTNAGEEHRNIFLSFDGAYHGDTFGAMAVGQGSGFHTPFAKHFCKVKTIPYPATWDLDAQIEEKEQRSIEILQRYLAKYSANVIAFILEPLIQGAGGMRMCRPKFLQAIIDLVKSYGIIVIFDEIMTGFGRTGSLFAYEQVKRVPDIICLSKGLTGGFLPMALTVASEQIYTSFLGDTYAKAFSHGHSYTANPLGCAAAIASLELLINPQTQTNIQQISAIHKECLGKLKDKIPNIAAVRNLGTIAAFNLDSEITNYTNAIGAQLKHEFLAKGLLMRPLGNTVYLLPPYCITTEELREAYGKIEEILGFL